MKETCESCKYFRPSSDPKMGNCVAGRPQVLLIPATDLMGRQQLQVTGVFPPTQPGAFCGEYTTQAAIVPREV